MRWYFILLIIPSQYRYVLKLAHSRIDGLVNGKSFVIL